MYSKNKPNGIFSTDVICYPIQSYISVKAGGLKNVTRPIGIAKPSESLRDVPLDVPNLFLTFIH